MCGTIRIGIASGKRAFHAIEKVREKFILCSVPSINVVACSMQKSCIFRYIALRLFAGTVPCSKAILASDRFRTFQHRPRTPLRQHTDRGIRFCYKHGKYPSPDSHHDVHPPEPLHSCSLLLLFALNRPLPSHPAARPCFPRSSAMINEKLEVAYSSPPQKPRNRLHSWETALRYLSPAPLTQSKPANITSIPPIDPSILRSLSAYLISTPLP